MVPRNRVLACQHVAGRDEPVGLMVGQWPQQHRVDDAEDRGVGADTERQRQHRDRREGGIALNAWSA